MKFQMVTDHKDVLGRLIKMGDIVLTIDTVYRTGAYLEVGICVGSTPKMLRVATVPRYGDRIKPEVSIRHLSKTLIIKETDLERKELQEKVFQIRELLISNDFLAHDL